jgi:hypothetical protein
VWCTKKIRGERDPDRDISEKKKDSLEIDKVRYFRIKFKFYKIIYSGRRE